MPNGFGTTIAEQLVNLLPRDVAILATEPDEDPGDASITRVDLLAQPAQPEPPPPTLGVAFVADEVVARRAAAAGRTDVFAVDPRAPYNDGGTLVYAGLVGWFDLPAHDPRQFRTVSVRRGE